MSEIEDGYNRGYEYASSYNKAIEFNFYEDVNHNILGFQIGQNLNSDGATANAEIMEAYTIPDGLIITINSTIRKVIMNPHANYEFYDKNSNKITATEFFIQLSTPEFVTGNVFMNAVTGEARKEL